MCLVRFDGYLFQCLVLVAVVVFLCASMLSCFDAWFLLIVVVRRSMSMLFVFDVNVTCAAEAFEFGRVEFPRLRAGLV